ncbi:hypothetical protein GPECTOR_3g303 [Gonium pectorale]|uniref:Beta-amylase n=1 Tax=Gonium pectorale TaxID=33097 RepID=A0A150GZB8_GONPE|nr:hypothetical protein GPECTOR_3g303 [Gonium pectorale]|eukprot:KXZ55155.1 hypothetical protein GPECTOR_3g303 [Gonium pectorale]
MEHLLATDPSNAEVQEVYEQLKEAVQYTASALDQVKQLQPEGGDGPSVGSNGGGAAAAGARGRTDEDCAGVAGEALASPAGVPGSGARPRGGAPNNARMHPANRYCHTEPDFAALATQYDDLAPYVHTDTAGRAHLDTTSWAATRALTAALLSADFGLRWGLPEGQLVPPVPNRANYIHWIRDLLDLSAPAAGGPVRGLDIGCGANFIYCLLGAVLYGWHMVGVDVTQVAPLLEVRDLSHCHPELQGPEAAAPAGGLAAEAARRGRKRRPEGRAAQEEDAAEEPDQATTTAGAERAGEGTAVPGAAEAGGAAAEMGREAATEARHRDASGDGEWDHEEQPGILLPAFKDEHETFAFTMCNPPFFESMQEAAQNPNTAFGGTAAEMVCPGGELAFVLRMLVESEGLQDRVHWFSTMVGKKSTLKVDPNKASQPLRRHATAPAGGDDVAQDFASAVEPSRGRGPEAAAAAPRRAAAAPAPTLAAAGMAALPRRHVSFTVQQAGAQGALLLLRRLQELLQQQGCGDVQTDLSAWSLSWPLQVNSEGVFRYAGSAWFLQALQLLVASGVHGVAMDFWWGAVEKVPGQYNWAGYKQALEVIKQTGLKVQAVLSFHACGGNVGDTVQIPLPEWVLQCAEADPDLFFADRPRNGGLGNRNREYISIWADDAPGVLRGRSPIQCYEDYMVSLRDTFSQELGAVIDEVVVGAGPCGELRLPSYVEANGWRFPGAGEFQCYDRRALASLAQAAREAGHPEWGYTGPHDAGEYNSTPEHTGFFSHNGSWNTPYGRFFLEWYSSCLLRHGERLLGVANQVFATKLHTYQAALHQQGLAMMQSMQAGHSQSLQFIHTSGSALSGGRMSTMSLNRILETGCSGVGIGNSAGDNICGGLASSAGGMDTAMMDVEPSDASHTSTVAAELMAGGGANAACMAFIDVANSLSPDGDEDSVGTSCGTNAVQEEADDMYAMVGGTGRLSDHPPMLAQSSSFANERRRSSVELAAGVAGVGVAASAAPQSGSALMSPTASCLAAAPPSGGMHLALKIAGIHWWYRSRSHAAELTAGYYNVDGRDGYAAIVDLCARHRANLVLTCVEMRDSQHPAQAQCGPEGLLRQLRQLAARAGVALSGENALPIFSSGGVDNEALDRIVHNMRAWPGRCGTPTPTPVTPYLTNFSGGQYGTAHAAQPMQLQPALAAGTPAGSNIVCVGYRMSESGRMVPVGTTSTAVNAQPQEAQLSAQQLSSASMSRCPSMDPQAGGYGACPSPAVPDFLPALRSFTFLRLVPEMLLPGYQKLWLHFMGRLLTVT